MLFWVPPSSDHASDEENKIWQFFKSQIIVNKLKYGISQIKNNNSTVNLLLEMLLILEFEPDTRVFISPLEVCNVLNSMELMKTTLAEKKKLADFFYRYDYDDESDKWVQKIQDHFEEETTQENAELFAQWLREGLGAIEKNYKAAEEILISAACYQQALKYRNGEVDGYPKDSKEAFEVALNLFGSLAKQGHKKAMHNKAMIHYKRNEYVKAYKWFAKAADKGLEQSLNNLLNMQKDPKIAPIVAALGK